MPIASSVCALRRLRSMKLLASPAVRPRLLELRARGHVVHHGQAQQHHGAAQGDDPEPRDGT